MEEQEFLVVLDDRPGYQDDHGNPSMFVYPFPVPVPDHLEQWWEIHSQSFNVHIFLINSAYDPRQIIIKSFQYLEREPQVSITIKFFGSQWP